MTPAPQTVFQHVRRYPKWYGVLAGWLLAMALIPVVNHPGPSSISQGGAANTGALAAAPSLAPAPVAPVLDVALAPAPPLPLPIPVRLPPSGPEPEPAAPAEPPQPGEPGLGLPPLPPLPFPAAPAELEPLFNAVSPMMTTGCSAIGLAAVVVAVVAPTVEDVPVSALMPYLAPLYSICAYFPIPKVRTICPLDDQIAAQLPDDLTALVTAPTVIGLGIDEIAGFEAAAEQMTGQRTLGFAESLRTQLGCRIES